VKSQRLAVGLMIAQAIFFAIALLAWNAGSSV
jgi:hypothetical protein